MLSRESYIYPAPTYLVITYLILNDPCRHGICQHLLAERVRSCGTRSLSPERPLPRAHNASPWVLSA